MKAKGAGGGRFVSPWSGPPPAGAAAAAAAVDEDATPRALAGIRLLDTTTAAAAAAASRHTSSGGGGTGTTGSIAGADTRGASGSTASSHPPWEANLASIPDVRGAPQQFTDPPAAVAAAQSAVTWTTAERSIFLALHATHGKDWRRVAAGLPTKSHRDVVRHYYDAKVLLGLGSRFAKSAGATPAERAATFARLAAVPLGKARAAVGPAGVRRSSGGGEGGGGGGGDPGPCAAGGGDGSSSEEYDAWTPSPNRTRSKKARGCWWWFSLDPPPVLASYEVRLPSTWAVELPPAATWDGPMPPRSFDHLRMGGPAMAHERHFLSFEDEVWEVVRLRDAIDVWSTPRPDPPGAVCLPLEMHPGIYAPVICVYVPPWGFKPPPPQRHEGASAEARGGGNEE